MTIRDARSEMPLMTPLERALAGLRDAVIVAALAAAPLVWGRFQASGLALIFCLLAAGWLAYLAAALFARRELAFVRAPLNLPVALLLVLALVSTIFASVNRYASLLEFYQLLSGAMLFWLIANQPSSSWRRRAYLAALLVAAAVVSWLGAREYVLQRVIGRNPSWRIFATFFNPNELAGFLALVIPLAGAAFLASRSAALRIVTGFAALLLVIALLLTGSRGGWLGFALGMFAFALLAGAAFRRTRLALATGVAVVALALLVSLAVPPLRARLFGSLSGEQSSNMFRYLTWKGAATMVAAHPWLGVGPDAFEFAYPRYAVGGFTRMAHQNYLQVAAEMGIPGGIAFLWMLGAFFWLAGKGFRKLRDRESRLLCAACIAGVLAFAMHSLLDYGWYIGAIELTVFALFGLAANTSAPPAAEPAPESAPRKKGARNRTPPVPEPAPLAVRRLSLRLSPAGRWVALVIAAAVAVLAGRYPVQAHLAAAQDRLGRVAEARGNLLLAESHYREAARLAPGSGEYRRQLGRVLGAPAGIKQLERALELEPTNALNRLVLAQLYQRVGPWDLAVSEYQRAIELNPNFLGAYRRLAELEARRGLPETALALYRRMIEIERSPYEKYKALEQRVEPEYAYAHYALGRAALERGDLPGARAELERALAILRERETVGAGLAAMLRAMGELSGAAEQELINLRARILWRLAQVDAKLGEESQAESLRVQAWHLDPQVELAVQQEPPLTEKGGKKDDASSGSGGS